MFYKQPRWGLRRVLALGVAAGLTTLSVALVAPTFSYADDNTSTSTVQADSSSQDAAAKAAADKKAQEEADAAKAKADKEAADKAAAEAQAKADAAKATPSSDPSPTVPADPPSSEAAPAPSSPSPSPQVAAKAKVASVNVVTYDPVTSYLSKVTLCGAAGFDVHSDAPSKGIGVKYTDDGGGVKEEVYKPGDPFRANTSHTSLSVYVYLVDDPSKDANLSIDVLQGDDCKTSVTPPNKLEQVGNVVTIPDTPCLVFSDADGNILDSGPITLTKDTTFTVVPDEGCRFPVGVDNPTTYSVKYTAPADDTDTKMVELCHATSSDSNPYTDITVSVAAFYKAGHIDHSGDIWAAFSYTKKGVVYNVAAQGDQSILANGCVKPKPKEQYALVLWKVDKSRAPYTDGMPVWPQDYTKSVIPVSVKPTEATIKAAFPAELKGAQKCVAYQGDGYKYTTKSDQATVDGLVAGGVLTDYADSSVYIAHAYYVNSDCTTYVDAPKVDFTMQQCRVGDQGVATYTAGSIVVTASDKVTVVVRDSNKNVVSDLAHVVPGVYSVTSTSPTGIAWNDLPSGWSYLDKTKTTIVMTVTVDAAKDCSIPKPPGDYWEGKWVGQPDCDNPTVIQTKDWKRTTPVWNADTLGWDLVVTTGQYTQSVSLTTDQIKACHPVDVPTIVFTAQQCTVGDQGTGIFTGGSIAITKSEGVGDVKVFLGSTEVTNLTNLQPGQYAIVAPLAVLDSSSWKPLPAGWVYNSADGSIYTTVNIDAAKDCTVLPPPPVRVPYSEELSDCTGFYLHSWDMVQYPVWNAETKTFDLAAPVKENEVTVLERALTNEEWWNMGCAPVQPPDEVTPFSKSKTDCNGVWAHKWDSSVTYSWVPSGIELDLSQLVDPAARGSWVANPAVVINDTGWVKVRDLTHSEKVDKGCITTPGLAYTGAGPGIWDALVLAGKALGLGLMVLMVARPPRKLIALFIKK